MRWFARLLKRRQLDSDLDKELAFHLERQASGYMEQGSTPDEAKRKAALHFGGPEQVKEACRDARGTAWLESVWQDVVFSLRTLRKAPGFALIAVCTLALGIAANTAVFSVIHGVVLKSLPFADAARLAAVDECLLSGKPFTFSYLDFQEIQRENSSFAGIAARRNHSTNLTGSGDPDYLRGWQVSANFFQLLGVKPIKGRLFRPEEDSLGTSPVVMIGYSLWQRRFGGRPDIIGKSITLSGRAFTVIGIVPAEFRFNDVNRQVFSLIGQSDEAVLRSREFHPGITAVARLKPEVSWQQADAEMRTLGSRLAKLYPNTNRELTFKVLPLRRQMVGDAAPTLFLLGGAVGLVLLIACANTANLFLTRALSRSRELSVRAALGASRFRLVRQLLTESLLLALSGGALGLALAYIATKWALVQMPDWLPRTQEVSFDLPVLLFTLLLSLLTGILFGILPAFRSHLIAAPRVSSGNRLTTRGVARLQSGFVLVELSLAVVLLTGAGLMIRTLSALWSTNPGFDTGHLLTLSVGLSSGVLGDPARIGTAWDQIVERVSRTPGVEAVSVCDLLPLTGENEVIHYWAGSGNKEPENAPLATLFIPGTGYLKALGIPLLAGRFFTAQDRGGNATVIVISQSLSARMFPGQSAIGRSLSLQWLGRARIVGVAGDVKHISLDQGTSGTEGIYLPFLQLPPEFMQETATGMTLLVRTTGDPLAMASTVSKAVMGPDRDQPVHDVASMEQIMRDSIAKQRVVLYLLAGFSGLALILALIGIYGVIAYWTAQRVQEVGIRMALGAAPGQVSRLFLSQGLRMVGLGIAIGLSEALFAARLMKSLIYGVSPEDPLTLGGVLVLLCAVAAFAILVPARRAAAVDPIRALRHE